MFILSAYRQRVTLHGGKLLPISPWLVCGPGPLTPTSHFCSSWSLLQSRQAERYSLSVSHLIFQQHPGPSRGHSQCWSPGSVGRLWRTPGVPGLRGVEMASGRLLEMPERSESPQKGWCAAVGLLGEEGSSNQQSFQKAHASFLHSR